jgi:hypothetical protein
MPHRTQIKADNQGSELLSSFVARQVMIYAFKVDVTAIGLDEMREYPELGSYPPYTRFVDGADTSSCLWYDSLIYGRDLS